MLTSAEIDTVIKLVAKQITPKLSPSEVLTLAQALTNLASARATILYSNAREK